MQVNAKMLASKKSKKQGSETQQCKQVRKQARKLLKRLQVRKQESKENSRTGSIEIKRMLVTKKA